MWIHLVLLVRALSMGPISPLPAGIPMHAWRSLPRSFSNAFRGIVGVRAAWCSSSSNAVTFPSGSWIHRWAPSNTQPRISFRTAHTPSPAKSFLIEMGSSPAWPVTAGGGNTWCIALSRARDRCRRSFSSVVWATLMKSSTNVSRS